MANLHRQIARRRPATETQGKVDRLLTVAEAAERLGTTERFPRRLIAQGRIEYVKLSEGRNGPVRIRESVLAEFIAEATVQAGR